MVYTCKKKTQNKEQNKDNNNNKTKQTKTKYKLEALDSMNWSSGELEIM